MDTPISGNLVSVIRGKLPSAIADKRKPGFRNSGLETSEDESDDGHQSPILESNFPTMSLASAASRLAALAVALAVLSALLRMLTVAFNSAAVHALPSANFAAHAEASAMVLTVFALGNLATSNEARYEGGVGVGVSLRALAVKTKPCEVSVRGCEGDARRESRSQMDGLSGENRERLHALTGKVP